MLGFKLNHVSKSGPRYFIVLYIVYVVSVSEDTTFTFFQNQVFVDGVSCYSYQFGHFCKILLPSWILRKIAHGLMLGVFKERLRHVGH